MAAKPPGSPSHAPRRPPNPPALISELKPLGPLETPPSQQQQVVVAYPRQRVLKGPLRSPGVDHVLFVSRAPRHAAIVPQGHEGCTCASLAPWSTRFSTNEDRRYFVLDSADTTIRNTSRSCTRCVRCARQSS
ncbi:hypothetical protein WJX72_005467 [[Myrmecia] bisecta]|uniref:Uncharacterized protein n=1 Tax=[Myrmecia] bisecta TaxID=41462 RepID=A0AAW1QF68_9CHLO